ncbi:serine/threonine-protein kinase [Coleofasciculus sp. FACHB-SPT9]|uniref:serine/threonine-protein kinase n=1 Tax=Cyanophyceae TaxID=3028117 RepID=UPI0016895E70|nr:serine/threonine-protein kinase [Coleofasciculus sp. FACHB-SPT9]MBD1890220.1 protein kinase [Coleofasciculus sp. FACHB-SPT9]
MPLYCTKGHENPIDGRFCQHCGEPLPAVVSNTVLPGMTLGDRYRIVRELGHGGFGRTYLSEDLNRFNEPCVLKEFAPKVQGTYALQKASELFEREAGVLYKLKHPQIPNFRELFRVNQRGNGRLFLVQDYVEGQTYRALLESRKHQGARFSEPEVRQILLQILPVLEYIHSMGVIHRDIAPDNMISRASDQLPVLIDFGGVKEVAATVESEFSETPGMETATIHTRLGKPGYAPDEQMQRGIVFPHSDLYALAATMLVLLTGKQPQELIDDGTLLWNWRRDVNLSPALGAVLDKMLSRRPGDRYQSASAVLQSLSSAHSPAPAPDLPPTQPPTKPPMAPTMVVARAQIPPPPKAIANSPQPIANATQPIPTPNPLPPPAPKPQSPFLGLVGKTLVVSLLITGATGIGWWAGNLWIQSLSKPGEETSDATPSPSSSPPVDQENPSSQFSPAEQARKQQLRDRRQSLGVNYNFYVNWVNEVFWTQNPNQRGRTLGNGPENEQLREQWDRIATELLDKLDQAKLPGAARQRLGSYGAADRDRWKGQVNQRNLSSRALYDLADVVFFQVFPEQRGRDFLNQPVGQIWHAIAGEKVKAVQSQEALETIRFASGAVGKRVSGTLQPGEGKAYIGNFAQNQLLAVNFTGSSKLRLSLYPPTSTFPPILEDSTEKTWSGTLPQSGYYEFIVVSEASQPVDYQLDIGVENPPAPSPESAETTTASPEPAQTTTPSP